MNPQDLIARCDAQIALTPDNPAITLVMRSRFGKTNVKRLCKGGPKGEIVSDNPQGPGCIVIFDAREVKSFVLAATTPNKVEGEA